MGSLGWMIVATALASGGWPAAREAETRGQLDRAAQACAGVLEDGAPAERSSCERLLTRLDAVRGADGSLAHATVLALARAGGAPERHLPAVRGLVDDPTAPLPVRLQAAAWLAHDALERRADPAAALIAADDGLALDGTDRPLIGLRARSLALLGRLDEARSAEDRLGVPELGTTPVDVVARAARNASLARVAWVLLAGCALLLGPPAVAGARRERPLPLGLVPLTVAVVGFALIAGAWQAGAGDTALPLWAAVVVLHLLAASGLRELARRGVRWLPAARVLVASATLGAVFLVLDAGHALPWVGL